MLSAAVAGYIVASCMAAFRLLRNVCFSYSGTSNTAMSIPVYWCTDQLYGEICDKIYGCSQVAARQFHANYAHRFCFSSRALHLPICILLATLCACLTYVVQTVLPLGGNIRLLWRRDQEEEDRGTYVYIV